MLTFSLFIVPYLPVLRLDIWTVALSLVVVVMPMTETDLTHTRMRMKLRVGPVNVLNR